MKKLIIYTDGGARGNPGPSGIGAVLLDENRGVVKELSRYIGKATNNQAEYQALIMALDEAKKIGVKEVDVFMDSELIVKQINREYKVKNKDLAPLFIKVYNLTLNFSKVNFTHVRREQNKRADELVNLAIDKALG